MSEKKKWKLLSSSKFTVQSSQLQIKELLKILLENRGIVSAEEKESFLHPKLESVTVDSVGIDRQHLEKALERIKKAITEQEQVIVFGDYDVDGITGTAILWESLHALGAKVLPYIPGRIEEGYGLSLAGISNVKNQVADIKLIITVDNGIVANDAVAFANEQGIEVIITDHHTRGDTDPEALAIVHTTKLCGAGVAYLLTQEINNEEEKIQEQDNHLELVCLATIADLVPLTGANRTLVKFGLQALQQTERVGLLELFDEAGVDQATIGVYAIGHIIGPRLNAMGRMASAMDSLRLLCTKDRLRAKVLAEKLGRTNKERQVLTQEMAGHALESVQRLASNVQKIIIVADESYEQGVIGLVASKLVETYYRPAIVLSKGKTHTKASARSIAGFNIIAFIREHMQLLVNAGGHPMAAGFTVETEKLAQVQEAMEMLAEEQITADLLVRTVKIDCELPLEIINQDLYDAIQSLAPFGMGNAEPVFVSRGVIIQNLRAIGAEGKHLKLEVRSKNQEARFSAIAFGMGEFISEIRVGNAIDVAYVIDENEWNGRKSLQLKVKDIQVK
jgi:single-stranded-DNA-specific exonuclease